MIRRPVCVLGLLLSVVLFFIVKLLPQPDSGITGAEGQWTELSGRVVQKEYKNISDQSVLLLTLDSITFYQTNQTNQTGKNNLLYNETAAVSVRGILCYVEEGEEPAMGAVIRITGRLSSFAQATNPGAFDSRQYYRILKLDGTLKKAGILEISEDYSHIAEGLYQVKRVFSAALDRCFSTEDASVMKAMLLGEKSGLSPELKKLYQDNGIIHILAISGLHISLIGMGIYKLLCRLRVPAAAGIVLSIVLIWCYGEMTAMGASAVRAIVMFSLKLAAKQVGRTYDMLTAISVAGILLLFEQPLYLNHSGFLFSFGAVLSLAILAPVFRLKKLPSVPLAVTAATLPVHLYYYFQFPVYSILLNLVIIPLMTAVMGGGLFCMTIGGLLPWAGKTAGAGVSLILSFYELLCNAVKQLPGSQWITGRPEPAFILLYFIILAGICIWQRRLPPLLCAKLLLAAVMILTSRPDHGLMITVLDVGQGDGIHIRYEDRLDILIDGGSSSQQKLGTYQLLPALKEAGTDRLDAVFITHPDQDHMSGLEELIQEQTGGQSLVRKLVLPDIAPESRQEAYQNLEKKAQENHIPILYMSSGQSIETGKVKITALHPPKGFVSNKPNEYSLVLLVEYGAFRGLFTGDVEGRGERLLLERPELLTGEKITFLKVAHHGSEGSTSRKFLDRIRPYSSVISCGLNNRYGHPGRQLIERLEESESLIYLTKEGGAVRLFTNGSRLKIKTFCQDGF